MKQQINQSINVIKEICSVKYIHCLNTEFSTPRESTKRGCNSTLRKSLRRTSEKFPLAFGSKSWENQALWKEILYFKQIPVRLYLLLCDILSRYLVSLASVKFATRFNTRMRRLEYSGEIGNLKQEESSERKWEVFVTVSRRPYDLTGTERREMKKKSAALL